MLRRWVAALALLGAFACTSDSRAKSSTTTTPTSVTPSEWTGAGPSPRSSLLAVADQVVYLGGPDGAVELVALDATSGAMVWHRAAALPILTSGQRPAVLVDGDSLIVLDGTGSAVIAVDARSGEPRWRAPLTAPATSNLFRCGDGACITVGPTAETASVQQIDRDDGTVVDIGRVVGATVIAASDDQVLSVRGDALLLARQHGTQEVWRLPAATLSDGTPADPAAQWRAWRGRNGTWVVWTAAPGSSVGMAAGLTVTGSMLWHTSGARPCSFVDDQTARAGHDEYPVPLCFGEPTRLLVGLDPLSGAGAWQLDEPGLDGPGAAIVVRTSDRSWLLHTMTDDIEVDIVQGPRKPGDDVVGGWCGTPDPFPCTIDGSPTGSPEAVPSYAGVNVRGFSVWVQDGVIRGYKPA